jgi:hypothetical protein
MGSHWQSHATSSTNSTWFSQQGQAIRRTSFHFYLFCLNDVENSNHITKLKLSTCVLFPLLIFVVQVFIMVMVVAITLILDLAIAVIAGCLCACLVFAWDAGTRLTVRRHFSNNKRDSIDYSVQGPLYFGSVKPLMEALFPLDDDDESPKPKRATIDLRETEIYDVR